MAQMRPPPSLINLHLSAGQQEARAWTIKKQTKAAQAAGVIHSDFEKKFIRADTIHWQQLVYVSAEKKKCMHWRFILSPPSTAKWAATGRRPKRD